MAEITTTTIFLIMFLFLSLLCLVEGIYWHFAGNERRSQRLLKKRLEQLKALDTKPLEGSLLMVKAAGGIPLLNQWLDHLRGLKPLRTLMLQANVPWRLEVFMIVDLLSGGVGLALGFLKYGPVGGLMGAALGVFLPIKILSMKKKRRLKQFEKQLPESLELMARGLKAGHAFTTGLQLVANEMPDPIGGEFFRTFKEHSHGLDLNTALLNLCHRVDLRDLRFFTTAVMIQRETGGNLAEILDKIASLIRERFKLRNQVKALTAEGRLSGLVLVMLTPVTALGLLFMNPSYVMLLVEHPLGKLMSGTAVFFQGVGMLCIRKIVNIKV